MLSVEVVCSKQNAACSMGLLDERKQLLSFNTMFVSLDSSTADINNDHE
jgi:hypothetical protein